MKKTSVQIQVEQLNSSIPQDLPDRGLFVARLERYLPEMLEGLKTVYSKDLDLMLIKLLAIMVKAHM